MTVRVINMEWLETVPPVTRGLLVVSIAAPILLNFNILSYGSWEWSWRLLKRGHMLRLITPFFVKALNFNLMFSVFMRYQYSRLLEDSQFSGDAAAYTFMLLQTSIVTAMINEIGFGGANVYWWDALSLAIIYVWSKYNPEQQVSFYFGIKLKAKFLPFILAAMEFMFTAGNLQGVIGIFSGHVYYFGCEDLQLTYMKTPPVLLKSLFAQGKSLHIRATRKGRRLNS